MSKKFVIALIVSTFCWSSCINDKPTGPDSGPTPSNQTVQPPAKGASASTTKRPTENIKVSHVGSETDQKKNPRAEVANTKPVESPKQLEAARQKAIKQAQEKKEKSMKAWGGKTLPSACDLVNPTFIAQTIGGVQHSAITVKDGSGKNSPDAKACFFKWDDEGNPNAGVLVQVQRNPLPGEFPDWAKYYVNAKLNQGDQIPDGSGSHRYKKFSLGQQGAYNFELARYVWRNETDNVFMVAFNLFESTEAEQIKWAEKIGEVVMKNFANHKG